MKWLIALGMLMLISSGTFVVWMFFKGANAERVKEESMWDELQEELSNEFCFRFFGDCGAPSSLEKKFKPYFLSSNSMVGVKKDGASVDVLDFTISENRMPDSHRLHGIIFQLLKCNLNYNVIDKSKTLSFDSKQGDYQLIESPNKNYAYLMIVEDDYYPVVFDSIGWRIANNTEDTMRANLRLVHKYMDAFCTNQKEDV